MKRAPRSEPNDPEGTEHTMYPDEFQATLDWLDKYKAQKRGDPEGTQPAPGPKK